MKTMTSMSFVRGSSLCTMVSPGKYWPRVMSLSIGAPPFLSADDARP